MLVMVGASASGKTEIAKLIIRHAGFKKMVTYTTRPMRKGEKDGVDYHFLSVKEFLKRRAEGFFVETSEYNGHYYGTSFDSVAHDRVLIVDPSGANTLYARLGGKAVFFLLETPKSIRAERMFARGDTLEDIEKRLERDDLYFDRHNLTHIDFIIDTSKKSLDELCEDILARYRRCLRERNRL